jgi:CheY-like chemotaxis protein/HPt (histidine-containing phosphotransfer) domain-containing protein
MRQDRHDARERLIRLGGPRLANELAAIYLDEMPRRIAVARIALREGDAELLGDTAHGMRSSSAQLGATDLASACEEVELAAHRGDVVTAASRLMAVESRYEEFAGWLVDQAGVDSGAAAYADGDDMPRTSGREPPIVAVIEDNVDNRLLLDAILGEEFVIDEYGAGPEALAAMPRRVPDVVLLDVSLPGMDGLQVLARMRSDPVLRDVPVVAVTAHAMAGDRERYLAAGFDGYVPKPIVDERIVIGTIETLLVGRRRGGEP